MGQGGRKVPVLFGAVDHTHAQLHGFPRRAHHELAILACLALGTAQELSAHRHAIIDGKTQTQVITYGIARLDPSPKAIARE